MASTAPLSDDAAAADAAAAIAVTGAAVALDASMVAVDATAVAVDATAVTIDATATGGVTASATAPQDVKLYVSSVAPSAPGEPAVAAVDVPLQGTGGGAGGGAGADGSGNPKKTAAGTTVSHTAGRVGLSKPADGFTLQENKHGGKRAAYPRCALTCSISTSGCHGQVWCSIKAFWTFAPTQHLHVLRIAFAVWLYQHGRHGVHGAAGRTGAGQRGRDGQDNSSGKGRDAPNSGTAYTSLRVRHITAQHLLTNPITCLFGKAQASQALAMA